MKNINKNSLSISGLCLILLTVLFSVSQTHAQGASIVVNTLAEGDDGVCNAANCTLREAVKYAPAGATITFSVTGTIEMKDPAISIAKDLTIIGPGAGSLTLSGNGNDGVNFTSASLFGISSGIVGISGLTLRDGTGATSENLGGAIYMTGGTVTVTGTTLSNNRGSGGAICVGGGSLTIVSSTLSGNVAGWGGGGAIRMNAGSSLLMTDSTISGNRNTGVGGGVYLRSGATATVTNSTISGNSAAVQFGGGGGFFNLGNLTIINSTISGNSTTASEGGGIIHGGGGIKHNGGQLTVANSTITRNDAFNGGGIHSNFGAVLNLSNSIVAGNTVTGSGPDLLGTVTAGDYNLVQNTSNVILSGTHNITGQSANLGALANNGGSTQTHALLAGSPAINAGSNALIPSGVTTDQRGAGFARFQGSAVDIGAFEAVQPPTVTTPTSANLTTTTATLGGNVASDGGAAITERGVVYAPTGTNPDPLIGGTGVVKVTRTGTTGVFTVAVTGLTQTTGYSFKAYATNSLGTSYSSVATFTTTLPDPTGAAGLVVTTNADVRANDGVISLRDAVAYANSGTAGATPEITFSVTGTITLTTFSNITRSMTITGPGAGILSLNGNARTRMFKISSGDVRISGLTLTNGSANSDLISGGTIFLGGGALTLTNCILSDSVARYGGGIYVGGGSLTISSSTISGSSDGSGIYMDGGSLLMTDSTVSGNLAGESGGGVFLNTNATATVKNSTVSGNSARGQFGGGGGFFNHGNLTITQSTISGNSTTAFRPDAGVDGGGGIYNFGVLTVTASTISANTAYHGGGIHTGSNPLTMSNSIVAGNTVYNPGFAPDLLGNATGDYNLLQNMQNTPGRGLSGTNNITGQPALLGPLSNNGGPTQTHALLGGSPAIDKGSATVTDQRGLTRPVDNPSISNAEGGNGADIGAFEVQLAPTAASVSVSGRVSTPLGRGLTNATVTMTDASGNVRTVRTGTFGYFRFDGVEAGQTHVFNVNSKRFTFVPQVVSVMENLTDLNFTAQ